MIFLAALPDENDIPKFEQFYNKYKGLMGKIAYEHIHDYSLSEDCVNECMLYIAQNFDRIDDINSKKTLGFVIRLARARAINFYNKQMKINANETELPDDANLPDVIDDVLQGYYAEELAKALNEMPDKYSDVFVMRVHYGFSYAEIAADLGITEATARKRFERAKTMLYELQQKIIGKE